MNDLTVQPPAAKCATCRYAVPTPDAGPEPKVSPLDMVAFSVTPAKFTHMQWLDRRRRQLAGNILCARFPQHLDVNPDHWCFEFAAPARSFSDDEVVKMLGRRDG